MSTNESCMNECFNGKFWIYVDFYFILFILNVYIYNCIQFNNLKYE